MIKPIVKLHRPQCHYFILVYVTLAVLELNTYIPQAGPEFTETRLLLPLKFWVYRLYVSSFC